MGTVSWLCAKSRKSIPAPEAAPNPMKDCRVHLFLPNEVRITGHLTGYGLLSVDRAFNEQGHPILIPYEINVPEYIAEIEGCDQEAAFEHVKVIRDDQFTGSESYARLPYSLPCPYQGTSYPPAIKAEHLYNGDYFAAWADEFGSPCINNQERAYEVKQLVMEFIEEHLSSTEIQNLINGDSTLVELMEDHEARPFISARSAEYAFLMLLHDNDTEMRLTELANSAGPAL